MAPEVVLGVADTDHRVDLYALGCVAYWLLTGKLVFEGKSAVEVMFHHAHTAPAAPSPESELPIPAPLEDLVMECLEKDPARRPPSAEAVSTRLSAVPLDPGLDRRARRALVGDAPAPAGGRAPCGGCAPVSRGSGAADRSAGQAEGIVPVIRLSM